MEQPHKPQKITPGSLLFDRYLVEVVGRGRATNVRLIQALDQQSGERVAMKVQPLDVGQREAALLARLAHPHLVRYLSHQVLFGTSYLIEEWVEGERLSALRGTCSREHVLHLGNELADVLAHLHMHRVVHADLDGDNVLARSGHVVVIDLGLAQEFTPDDPDCAYWVASEIEKARHLLADLIERARPDLKQHLRQQVPGTLETVQDLRLSLQSLPR
jgi:serine/threonine protein kinase